MNEQAATRRALRFAKGTLRNYKKLQADLGDTEFHNAGGDPYFGIGIFPREGRVHLDGVVFDGEVYEIDIRKRS